MTAPVYPQGSSQRSQNNGESEESLRTNAATVHSDDFYLAAQPPASGTRNNDGSTRRGVGNGRSNMNEKDAATEDEISMSDDCSEQRESIPSVSSVQSQRRSAVQTETPGSNRKDGNPIDVNIEAGLVGPSL